MATDGPTQRVSPSRKAENEWGRGKADIWELSQRELARSACRRSLPNSGEEAHMGIAYRSILTLMPAAEVRRRSRNHFDGPFPHRSEPAPVSLRWRAPQEILSLMVLEARKIIAPSSSVSWLKIFYL